jgi:hypothetical protein
MHAEEGEVLVGSASGASDDPSGWEVQGAVKGEVKGTLKGEIDGPGARCPGSCPANPSACVFQVAVEVGHTG